MMLSWHECRIRAFFSVSKCDDFDCWREKENHFNYETGQTLRTYRTSPWKESSEESKKKRKIPKIHLNLEYSVGDKRKRIKFNDAWQQIQWNENLPNPFSQHENYWSSIEAKLLIALELEMLEANVCRFRRKWLTWIKLNKHSCDIDKEAIEWKDFCTNCVIQWSETINDLIWMSVI